MTILHLISSGGLYGAEAVILNLSRVLQAGGEHRSVLGVFDNGPEAPRQVQAAARNAAIEVHEIPCRGQIDRAVPARLRAVVEATNADIVHAHGYKADVYAALALRGMRRCALVSTCHTWYDNDLAVKFYGALDRFVLRGFAGVVAVSDEVRLRLLRAGVRAERIRLVRNGVDLRPFAAAREGLPRESGEMQRVGLVGRLAPEKGIDILLRAIALLVERSPVVARKTQFRIIGEGPDRASLEALRDELKLAAQVRFDGHCSDMPGFYASLDLLVSASRQEGLPIALLEGMGSGLALLATTVGEVPTLAGAGKSALLVPPNDPAALANGMERLLRDAALRNAMGTAAQHLIAEQFSAEAMTADYLDLYRAVLPTHSAAYLESGHAARVR